MRDRRHKKEGHVKMEAEIRVMQPQANRSHQKLEEERKDPPPGPLERE